MTGVFLRAVGASSRLSVHCFPSHSTFSSRQCPHCQALAPEYSAAATTLRSSRPDVVLAKVDATENKALARRFGVKGFPTLKWFRDGVAHEYTGGRSSASEIVAWIQQKTGVLLQHVNSASDVDAMLAERTHVLVAFVQDAVGGAEVAVLQEAAEVLEENIALVSDKHVAIKIGIGAVPPTVTLLRTFEERMVVLDQPSSMTVDGLVSFVRRHRRPSLLAFSTATASTVLQAPYQLLCFASAQDDIERLQPVLKRAAAALRSSDKSVLVVTVNAASVNETASVYTFFGISGNSTALPAVRGFTNLEGKMTKFKPHADGDLSLDALVAFGRSLLNGTAKAYYTSQQIPTESQDPGAVTIVVGDTFDAIVLDRERDVLLEVYAPWCQHCRALEPVYERLAKRFRRIDSVVITKMDGTANEHPAASATQYPTLLFYPATGDAAQAKGAPVVYDGARTVSALTKFVKKHATVPYELPRRKEGTHPDSDLLRR